jgi:hypothetical protein
MNGNRNRTPWPEPAAGIVRWVRACRGRRFDGRQDLTESIRNAFSRSMGRFKNSRLARMSSGHYCLIRDLGLVKGGKGLRHHEVVLDLSWRGLLRLIIPSHGRPAAIGARAMTVSGASSAIAAAGRGEDNR